MVLELKVGGGSIQEVRKEPLSLTHTRRMPPGKACSIYQGVIMLFGTWTPPIPGWCDAGRGFGH